MGGRASLGQLQEILASLARDGWRNPLPTSAPPPPFHPISCKLLEQRATGACPREQLSGIPLALVPRLSTALLPCSAPALFPPLSLPLPHSLQNWPLIHLWVSSCPVGWRWGAAAAEGLALQLPPPQTAASQNMYQPVTRLRNGGGGGGGGMDTPISLFPCSPFPHPAGARQRRA